MLQQGAKPEQGAETPDPSL